MLIAMFIIISLLFICACGCVVYWEFFEDAEDYFYRSLLSLTIMSIITATLKLWSDEVFSSNTMKWITLIAAIIVVVSVITYIIRYIFDSLNDLEVKLFPFLIPIIISVFSIINAFFPQFIKKNFTEIIFSVLGILGVIVAIFSFFSYKNQEKNIKNKMNRLELEMHHNNFIDSKFISLRDLSKDALSDIDRVLTELYLSAKSQKLSTSTAIYMIEDAEIPSEIIHRIIDRLFSNNLIDRCSMITLADFLQEVLPEIYINRRSYRSYSMDMRYYEDFYERLSESIKFQNNQAIDDLNKKIDSLNVYIKKHFKPDEITATTAEAHGRQNQIRELFHALETPIATSEMALSNLKLSFDSVTDYQNEKIEKITNAIKLIKSILFAYRELTFMNIYNDENVFFSLPEIINSIPELMSKNHTCDVVLEQRNIPNAIHKYSTNLIVVLILPLIHNAIEACPNNKPIIIEYSNTDSADTITIENHCKQAPRQVNLDTEGYSSKGNNHVGSGISIVKRISKSAGVDFSLKVNNNKVFATLIFPKL